VFFTGPPGWMFKKKRDYFELMICDIYRVKNTGPQSVQYSFCSGWKVWVEDDNEK
jgi:hypothetical protein